MKKLFITLLLLTVMVTSVLTGCGTNKGGSNEVNPQQGQPLGNNNISSNFFKEMDTTDFNGNPVDSSIFSDNKLTMVNVWNTGCTPCIEEIPVLDQINQDYAAKGVAVKGLIHEFKVGLDDKDRATVAHILSTANADYQQLLISAPMAEAELLVNLMAFPTTFFVNSQGDIIEAVEGARNYAGWKEVIEKVLEKVE